MGEGNNVVSINGAPVESEQLSDGEIHSFKSPRGGLYLSRDGVPGTWLYNPGSKSDPWVQLIRYPFTVVGEIQSGLDRRNVGHLVQYTDEGRQVEGSAPGTFPVLTDVLPAADMMDPRRLRAWLAAHNVKLLVTTPVLGQLTAPGVLAAYITASNHPRKIEERPVCGWVPKLDGYLLGSQVIGSDDYRPRLALSETPPPIRSGSLDGWLEHIAPQAAQHPVWVFGVLIAMAAPLMHLLGKDKSCGGFHFHGDSSTGKSIAGELAAGFYGHKPQTWRTTSNALEWSAAMHNHSVLVLDEIHMGKPEDLNDAIFLLANGLGKKRMAKDGTAIPDLEFSGLTVSSGEKSVKESMPREMSEGEIVRFLDVPMIYRDFDALTVARFKERINNEQQGHIGQAWIEHLSGGSVHLQQPPIEERLVMWRALYEKYLDIGIKYADARDSRVVRIWQRLAGLMMVADIAADDLLLPRDWFKELPDPEGHGFTNLCTQAVKQIYDQWAAAHGVVRGSRSALSGARSDAGLLVDWLSECIAADKIGEFRATPAPNPECLPGAGFHYDGTALPRNRNAIGGYIESVSLLNRSGKLSGDADRFLWIQARQLNAICTHVKGLRFIDAIKERGILSMDNGGKGGKRGNQTRYPSVNWTPVLTHNDTGPNLGTNNSQAYRIDLKKLQEFADGMS